MKDNNLKYALLRDMIRLRGKSVSDVDDYLLLRMLEPTEEEERNLEVVKRLYGCTSLLLLGVITCVVVMLLC